MKKCIEHNYWAPSPFPNSALEAFCTNLAFTCNKLHKIRIYAIVLCMFYTATCSM